MNKKSTIPSFITVFLILPVIALADVAFPEGGNIDSSDIMIKIQEFIWPLFTGFAVLMFIIAGVTFVSANGDASKVASAKKAVVWGIVGVAVAILSFSVVDIIANTIL